MIKLFRVHVLTGGLLRVVTCSAATWAHCCRVYTGSLQQPPPHNPYKANKFNIKWIIYNPSWKVGWGNIFYNLSVRYRLQNPEKYSLDIWKLFIREELLLKFWYLSSDSILSTGLTPLLFFPIRYNLWTDFFSFLIFNYRPLFWMLPEIASL